MKTALRHFWSSLRDPLNGLTHFIGIVLSVIGLIILTATSINPVRPWHLATGVVFGLGMIMLYTASTLYHWLDLSEKANLWLRKFDHMMIFILIAATYTPFCLIPMRGHWGWGIFATVWSLAVIGLFFKIFWMNAPRWLSTGLYVLMGWVAIIGIRPLIASLNPAALFWVFAGGISYTIGAVFYAVKRPVLKNFGFHEIFHIFVLGGTAAHFWAVYNYI